MGIVLEVDDNPLTLYVWAHLVAETMIENLHANGIIASVVRVHIDGLNP